MSFCCLLVTMASVKKFAYNWSVSYSRGNVVSLNNALLLSCFQEFFFSFQQFDYEVPGCSFLYTYSVWGLFWFLTILQIWNIWPSFPKFFFCLILPSHSEIPIMYMLLFVIQWSSDHLFRILFFFFLVFFRLDIYALFQGLGNLGPLQVESYCHSFTIAVFTLQWQRCRDLWPSKPDISTISFLQKGFTNFCFFKLDCHLWFAVNLFNLLFRYCIFQF